MKQDIHPNYEMITATCSCGNVIKVRSTLGKDISLDVCSECHPFYTGTQKIMDSGGRVDRFRQRFEIAKQNKRYPHSIKNGASLRFLLPGDN